MLKVLSSNQIKALDTYTIAHEPVASIDLMERASRAFVTWFTEKFDSAKKIGIVCGTGNNGGDGLCIARVLHDRNYTVKVWIIRNGAAETEDFKTNLKRLSGKIKATDFISDKEIFSDRDILIDAIFGSGLSRPVEGIYADAISLLNQAGGIRVAVDIPSGLFSDKHSSGVVLRAHHTVSFQLPKVAFFLPENYPFTGEWHMVNIGLSKDFIEKADASNFFIERKDVIALRKTRSKFSNKGNFGKALIISGSYGKMGAAVLMARAAIRSGLGLLTVHVPTCGYTIMQTAVPEAMINTDPQEAFFTTCPSLENYNAIGIGPGIGTEKETCNALANVLKNAKGAVVLDADALNILSAHHELIQLIPEASILTPHPKEFERLAGVWKDDFERLEKAKQFAIQTKSILILKGAYTSIISPQGNVYFNPTGNPGMATGGSGDVLTGILTGLLAQGYTSLETAQLGVYLHGLAGDLAAREKSMESLIASDLVDYLPKAFLHLYA